MVWTYFAAPPTVGGVASTTALKQRLVYRPTERLTRDSRNQSQLRNRTCRYRLASTHPSYETAFDCELTVSAWFAHAL